MKSKTSSRPLSRANHNESMYHSLKKKGKYHKNSFISMMYISIPRNRISERGMLVDPKTLLSKYKKAHYEMEGLPDSVPLLDGFKLRNAFNTKIARSRKHKQCRPKISEQDRILNESIPAVRKKIAKGIKGILRHKDSVPKFDQKQLEEALERGKKQIEDDEKDDDLALIDPFISKLKNLEKCLNMKLSDGKKALVLDFKKSKKFFEKNMKKYHWKLKEKEHGHVGFYGYPFYHENQRLIDSSGKSKALLENKKRGILLWKESSLRKRESPWEMNALSAPNQRHFDMTNKLIKSSMDSDSCEKFGSLNPVMDLNTIPKLDGCNYENFSDFLKTQVSISNNHSDTTSTSSRKEGFSNFEKKTENEGKILMLVEEAQRSHPERIISTKKTGIDLPKHQLPLKKLFLKYFSDQEILSNGESMLEKYTKFKTDLEFQEWDLDFEKFKKCGKFLGEMDEEIADIYFDNWVSC
jgi:hypothetical protein